MLQEYKASHDGYINIIDDINKDPIPSMTLHPRLIEKCLTDGNIVTYSFFVTISSLTIVTMEGQNCYDADCTDFFKACHEGNEAKVDRMLKDNNEVQKKVNMLAACGMNGFIIACRKGYAEMVSLFLKKASTLQLNVNAKDKKKGQTALTMAVLEGNLEIVKLLTQEQSIDLNTTDAEHSKTPFMHACQNGLLEIVTFFLKLAETKKSKDFDLNAKADNGNTAFHYACHAEKEDVVDLIIGSAGKLKIELQLMNNDGITGYDHWPEKFESNILTGTSKKPRLELSLQ